MVRARGGEELQGNGVFLDTAGICELSEIMTACGEAAQIQARESSRVEQGKGTDSHPS